MPRILIIDDERGIRSLLLKAFTRAGYEVRTAAHAREAMELCLSEQFDALISDVRMPGMDGHELVRWVARKYPEIRCILMTGFDDIDCHDCPYVSRCLYLGKPFGPTAVVAAVEAVLREKPPAIRADGTSSG